MALPHPSPYRKHGPLPERREPPAELVYRPGGSELRITPVRLLLRNVLIATPIAVLLATLGRDAWSVGIMGAAILRAIWKWRKSEKEGGIRLTSVGQELFVNLGGSVPLRIRLSALRTVVLDSKTINKAQREVRPDGIIAISRRAIAVDVSRIVFVLAEPEVPFPLTEEYVSQSDCFEWLGKIRMFLRLHGWVPEDEREANRDTETRRPHSG